MCQARPPIRTLGILCIAILAGGCDLEEEERLRSAGPYGSPGGATDAGTEAPLDEPDPCVPEDAPGNQLGVGEYCEAGGDQCDDNELAIFCSLDFDPNDSMAGCTAPCTLDDDCGPASFCLRSEPNNPASVARCRTAECVDISELN